MISKLEKFFRSTRLSISRNLWLVNILGLKDPSAVVAGDRPRGLILIQIDGLSKKQLERALQNHSMPFLQRLITRESFQVHSLYSGQPASTPAAQGELFYGVKGCVPAFSFRRHDDQRTVIMLEPNAAATVEARIAQQGGQPLLEGGSTFSNIFTGGAKESSFCASSLGWSSIMPTNNPFKMAIFALLNVFSFVRVAVLMVVELGLAVIDFFRGLIAGRDFFQELKYVPTRVAASVLMRELVTIGISLDAIRGLPIVHANLIGYDEQAHRRGPSSRFAHWSLKGIDGAIHRIWNTAKRSKYRDYDIWVYSDHGQEEVSAYPRVAAEAIQQAAQNAFADHANTQFRDSQPKQSGQQLDKTWSRRANWLGIPHFARGLTEADRKLMRLNHEQQVEVVAMGPLGFIYLPAGTQFETKASFAQALVRDRNVPIAMLVNPQPSSASQVFAWTLAGKFELPRDAAKVLGESHPFASEIGQDFAQMVCHPDAGDVVISGWNANDQALSFRMENGAHAGPGYEETHAFALLPGDAPLSITPKNYLRFLDLRAAALTILGREQRSDDELGGPAKANTRVSKHRQLITTPVSKAPEHEHCLRLLTYNIHSCIGMDGVVSTARIARVIAHYQPDVVALQELDIDQSKTDQVDQAKMIAEELSMDIHFHPIRHLEQGRFGNAILTDLPMRLVKAGQLSVPAAKRRPLTHRSPFNAPRGAVWVAIDFNGRSVNLINTHLGLTPKERREQVDTLLSEEWLNHPDCASPTILCGDFNATARQKAIRRLAVKLKDAQVEHRGRLTEKTFAGRYPTLTIDHVLVDHSINVKHTTVANNSLTKVASDHLPLIVDLEISKP